MKLVDRCLFTYNPHLYYTNYPVVYSLFAILKIHACLFSSLLFFALITKYVPNPSDLKGTKKKRGKGNKNKAGEGVPEKKKHKIEELKVLL